MRRASLSVEIRNLTDHYIAIGSVILSGGCSQQSQLTHLGKELSENECLLLFSGTTFHLWLSKFSYIERR